MTNATALNLLLLWMLIQSLRQWSPKPRRPWRRGQQR
jgi:hypothetical protein